MKIQEIIDFEPKVSKHTYPSYMNKLVSIGANIIGDGTFGTVYDTKSNKRLNQVTKVGDAGNLDDAESVNDDGFMSYLKKIHESNLKNPYFPRFSDLTIRTDPTTGKDSYRVNLQRLVRFGSKKICGNEELMRSMYDDMFTTHTTACTDFGPAMGICENILTFAMKEDYSLIQDNDLKEALQFINDVKRNSQAELEIDLSYTNMMWRITGNRPQLVLTDPLA